MSHIIAQLTNVVRSFSLGEQPPQTVLQGVNFAIHAGETVALLGSSGGGKSTLLNILGLLDSPTSGQVEIFGSNPETLSENAKAQFRAEKIGFVFQLHHLLPQLNVLENVLLPTLARTGQSREDNSASDAWAKHLLDRVGLTPHLHKKPSQLSGGERQRVAVVRALVNKPQLLLADEPTGSLDETNAQSLIQLLLELRNETSVAVLLVTHDSGLASKMSRVVRLKQGQLS